MALRLIGRLVLILTLAYVSLLTPVVDALAIDGTGCVPVTSQGQPPFDAEGQQDSDGEDPGPDDFLAPVASSLTDPPLSFLITLRLNTRLPLLARSLFRPPTLF